MAILGVGSSPVNSMEAMNTGARRIVRPISSFLAL
jgi:hypothetical protein